MKPLAYRVLYCEGHFYPQALTKSWFSFFGAKPGWTCFFFLDGYDSHSVRRYDTEEEATNWIKMHRERLANQGNESRVVREISA